MLNDKNDYPTSVPRRALRGAMFRSGLTERLGPRFWRTTDAATLYQIHLSLTVASSGHSDEFATRLWRDDRAGIGALVDFEDRSPRSTIAGSSPTAADHRAGRAVVRQSVTHGRCRCFGAIAMPHGGPAPRIDEAIVYEGATAGIFIISDRHAAEHRLVSGARGLSPTCRWCQSLDFESRFFAYLRARSPDFAGLNWRVQEPGDGCAWSRLSPPPRAFRADGLAGVRAMYGRVSEPKGRRVF